MPDQRDQPDPYEVRCRFPRSAVSVPRARAMLRAVLGAWGTAQDVAETAELLLSELAANALKAPTAGDPHVGFRVARGRGDGMLRLEVSDGGAGVPAARAAGPEDEHGRGLFLVESLADRWGVEPYREGKTVWAELKAPDLVPVPTGRQIAAATVRPGQTVRVWGAWRTVRAVRTEQFATGGLAVILGLDEGPALRVPAAEPLTVRGEGQDE